MGKVTRPQASPAALHGRSLKIEDSLIAAVGKEVQLQRLLQKELLQTILLFLLQLEGDEVPGARRDLKANAQRVLSARF